MGTTASNDGANALLTASWPAATFYCLLCAKELILLTRSPFGVEIFGNLRVVGGLSSSSRVGSPASGGLYVFNA